MARLQLIATLIGTAAVLVSGQVDSGMRSFSSAIKAGTIAAYTEKVLYEYESKLSGVITEQWFAGQGVMDENMRIRIYIDGEQEASIDFMLFLAHGIGSDEKTEVQYIPWGTKRIGHDADGAIYNTYQIPFDKSFRVTATHPSGGMFRYIIRGIEGMPRVVGNLELPVHNTRLRLYKNVDITLTPLQFITLANVNSTAGLLYQVTLFARSSDFQYLEACMCAKIDGNDITWLSSGTEDFFLSAYYFNRGVYHTENSGLTYKNDPGTMSAYKFFENDPVSFSKSFELIWRCGDTNDVDEGCPSDWPPPEKNWYSKQNYSSPLDTVVTTYAWVYEY